MITRIALALCVLVQVALLVPGTAGARAVPRTKPGPVTIRGIAVHVKSRAFDLKTTRHGTYTISLVAATAVSMKGQRGRAVLHENDHVGVRGFLHGRVITAISIRIYPVKPHPYTVRGTITSRSRSSIVVAGKRFSLTSQTQIHVGSSLGGSQDIHVGDRVQVRAVSSRAGTVALSVHVYRHTLSPKRVQVRGTIASKSGNTLVVRTAGGLVSIRLSAGTAIVSGTGTVGQSALRPGQTVTVSACCAGAPLVATRVRIAKSQAHQVVIVIRGSVIAISGTVLRVGTATGTATVSLSRSTVYQVGANQVAVSGVLVGDQVSIRALRLGRTLQAVRVHVFIAGRRTHTLTGSITSANSSSLVVQARGKKYRVTAGPGARVTVNGKTGSLSGGRPGDRVRIVGRLQGTTILATQISISRAAVRVKSTTVRGTVTQVRGDTLVIVDSTGTSHTVHLSSHVPVMLRGRAAPAALFAGAHATVRGTVRRGVLDAAKVTVSVQSKTVDGRVTQGTGSTLTVRRANGDVYSILLISGVVPTDGGRRVSHLIPGAFVRVQGYVQRVNLLRAVWVHIAHPHVSATGTVVIAGTEPTVETSRGDRFKVRFTAATTISTGRVSVPLHPVEIPVGARVRIAGRVGTDGTLVLDRLDVRLTSRTVRGVVAAITDSLVTVRAEGALLRARVMAETRVMQGTHTITLGDIVVGDDVTLYTAALGSSLYLRKLLVHRRLTSLDGTVTALGADGFVVTAADGEHRVIVTQTTQFFSGLAPNPPVGTAIHITGYQRGDGAVVATRVRPGKKRRGA